LVVFGRRAGRDMLNFINSADLAPLPPDPEFTARAQIADLFAREKGENAAEIRSAMQEVMMDKVSVVRDADGLAEAAKEMRSLRIAYGNVAIQDHGKTFNTDLLETHELGCMLDCAETIIAGAIAREESRGAHYRTDFEKRDDANWLAHTMLFKTSGGMTLRKKPVAITKFEPKERKY
jgi:succinate dehydrogenase / fumarate reductase, flavoprotein subunit